MEIIKVSVGSAVHARLMAPSRYLSTPFLFLFLLSFALLPHDPHSSNFDFSFAPSHYYFYPPFLSFLASSVLVNSSTANLTNFPRFSFSSPSFFFFYFNFRLETIIDTLIPAYVIPVEIRIKFRPSDSRSLKKS